MIINTKLHFKSYVKLMFALTYRKWVIILTVILALMFLFLLVMLIIGNAVVSTLPIFPLVFSFVFVFGMPAMVYYSAKKNFSTHARLQENISYEFTNELIKVTGESFSSQMSWDKVYRVLEKKDWFLIYENKMVANIIPKEFIGNNITELRELIKKHPKI